jgi:hypothetical protein
VCVRYLKISDSTSARRPPALSAPRGRSQRRAGGLRGTRADAVVARGSELPGSDGRAALRAASAVGSSWGARTEVCVGEGFAFRGRGEVGVEGEDERSHERDDDVDVDECLCGPRCLALQA